MNLPWIKFFPSDWIADVSHHSLEIEGAWIRIICHIHRRGEDFKPCGCTPGADRPYYIDDFLNR